MPTYEYQCSSCSNRYETKEGFDAPPRQPCPKCGAQAKRILFAPPIVFKGSGFYVTDSRKGGNAMVGDSLGASAANTGSESKGESAPAADAKPAAATTSSGDD